eukprot:9218149-Karenia_brevis.AAC.1
MEQQRLEMETLRLQLVERDKLVQQKEEEMAQANNDFIGFAAEMRQEILSLKEAQAMPAPVTPAPADRRPASETRFDVSATMDFDLFTDS